MCFLLKIFRMAFDFVDSSHQLIHGSTIDGSHHESSSFACSHCCARPVETSKCQPLPTCPHLDVNAKSDIIISAQKWGFNIAKIVVR